MKLGVADNEVPGYPGPRTQNARRGGLVGPVWERLSTVGSRVCAYLCVIRRASVSRSPALVSPEPVRRHSVWPTSPWTCTLEGFCPRSPGLGRPRTPVTSARNLSIDTRM